MYVSPLSHHLNILPFPCPAHLSVDNRKRTPRIHQHNTSLPTHVTHLLRAAPNSHFAGGRDRHCKPLSPPPALSFSRTIPQQLTWLPTSGIQTVVFRSLVSSDSFHRVTHCFYSCRGSLRSRPLRLPLHKPAPV